MSLTPLEEASPQHGSKAYRLRLLASAGLRVPRGVVMSSLDFVAAGEREIARACELAGCSFPVAVRLSPPLSAGLRVEYALSALGLRVAGSPSEARAEGLRLLAEASRLLGGAGPAGLILQALVIPKAAGAAYTASPITWAKKVIVEAVPGLADVFMSVGSPNDSFVFSPLLQLLERRVMKKDLVRVYSSGRIDSAPASDPWAQSISDDEAAEVAREALRASEAIGDDVELEWAYQGGVWALGARPLLRSQL